MTTCPRCGKQNPAEVHTCTPQPEALRLGQMPVEIGPISADELRRLHEENFALAAGQCIYNDGQGLTCDEYGNQVCTKEIDLRRLHAQRDGLLEALKLAAHHMHTMKDARAKADYSVVRAAIAKAEASK